MRKIAILLTGVVVSLFLHGCAAESTISYQDENMTYEEAAEQIEDQLESENPDLDLHVIIEEEIE